MIRLDPYDERLQQQIGIFRRWRHRRNARRHTRTLKKIMHRFLKDYEKTPINTGQWKQLFNRYNYKWHQYCERCYFSHRLPAPKWDGFRKMAEANKKPIKTLLKHNKNGIK